jgi:hypothetical protein
VPRAQPRGEPVAGGRPWHEAVSVGLAVGLGVGCAVGAGVGEVPAVGAVGVLPPLPPPHEWRTSPKQATASVTRLFMAAQSRRASLAAATAAGEIVPHVQPEVKGAPRARPLLAILAAGYRLLNLGVSLGLLYPAAYQQSEVQLLPGDLLVGFTDGISERMRPAEEEWGEVRLLAAIEASRDAPAVALIAALMRTADAFAAGAKQHDDMTRVVVRVL